jgi:hypothetical protein
VKIVEIGYSRTINLGNYESARIEARASIDSDEDPAEALLELTRWVRDEIEKRPSGRNGE